MPYITKDLRRQLDEGARPGEVGHLNYKITQLLVEYFGTMGGVSYTQINAVIGVLECAKLELYRRIAAPYETVKQGENGDVY